MGRESEEIKDGGRKTEVRSQGLEDRRRKTEVGSRKKLEVRDQKKEDRSQKVKSGRPIKLCDLCDLEGFKKSPESKKIRVKIF